MGRRESVCLPRELGDARASAGALPWPLVGRVVVMVFPVPGLGVEADGAPVIAAIRGLLVPTSEAPSQAEGEACLLLGTASRALGWVVEADAAFARARRLSALEPLAMRLVALPMTAVDAWNAIGVVLRSLEQLEGARAAFEQAIVAGGDRHDVHTALAMTQLALGGVEQAQRSLERALELKPGDPETQAHLSLILLQQGRLEEAGVLANQALERDPGLGPAHRSLSAIYAALGDEAASLRHRDQAYAGANLVILPAARAKARVLILSTTGGGNTPDIHLIPAGRYTRLLWFVEYATEEQRASLPPFDVAFNRVGDPDVAAPVTEAMSRFADRFGQRVLNDPRRVAMTSRDQTPRLLGDLADVIAPRTVRLDPAADAGRHSAALEGFDGPVLLRPLGSHGGEGLRRLEGVEDLPDLGGASHYVTAFHDFRSADGLYRKYRMFFVEGRPYPYHLAVADQWMVHHHSAGMEGRPDRIAEEARFLKDPETAIGTRAMSAVAAIGERIGLDFCGLDFSVLPDGQVLVFEANAAMLVHPEAPDGPFAHKNPHVERILDAFQRLLTPGQQSPG